MWSDLSNLEESSYTKGREEETYACALLLISSPSQSPSPLSLLEGLGTQLPDLFPPSSTTWYFATHNLLVVHVVELNRIGVIISSVAFLETLPDTSHTPAGDADVSTKERQNQNLKK